MSNKKALIIGGAGFVGRNLSNYLIELGNYEITVIDNFLSSNEFMVQNHPLIKVVHGDAGNIDTFDSLTPDYDEVYLLHCLHGNQSSIYNPLSDLENTLRPTVATYEWLRKYNSSASIVYAGAGCAVAEKTWDKPTGVVESDIVNLKHDSPYSISKLTGEMHSLFYADQFGLSIKRARFQNAYGPLEYLAAGIWRGTEATIWRNVIPTFIWKSLNNHDLIVTGENAARDFIFISDLVKGLHLICQFGKTGEAYNLATGVETSIKELANLIVNLCGSQTLIKIEERRNWDNSGRRFGNTKKSEIEIGFLAETNIAEGLIETVNWTRGNLSTISKLISNFEQNAKA